MSKQFKLTDTRIRNAKPSDKPLKLTDGGGLFMLITPGGSKLWRYRYRIEGKENVFALGEYGQPPSGESESAKATRTSAGVLSLSEAREALAVAKQLVKNGIHPSADRAQAKKIAARERATTFEGVSREWLSRIGSKWKAPTLRQRERLLEWALLHKPSEG